MPVTGETTLNITASSFLISLSLKFIHLIPSFQLRGMYMTRQLSFNGVTFDIKELPLTKDFIEMYDASVKLVSKDERLFLIPRSIIILMGGYS